jgi:transcription antitermination factor NusG
MKAAAKKASVAKAAKTRAFKKAMQRGRDKAASIEKCEWFAIRTEPGSQKPQREYTVELTSLDKDGKPRGKGYRIVPSLDPNMSAIERSLEQAGFEFWMPAEKRLVRDRRHTDLWKVCRFALMVGYVFIKEPHSFDKLKGVPGVSGVVSDAYGKPMAIDFLDILAVRAAEAEAEVDFDARSRLARQKLRKNAKNDPRLKKLVEKLDIAGNFTIPLDKIGAAA